MELHNTLDIRKALEIRKTLELRKTPDIHRSLEMLKTLAEDPGVPFLQLLRLYLGAGLGAAADSGGSRVA